MDIENMTVEEVLERVENGDITAEEALQAEQQGKNRKQLVKALQKLVGVEGDGETSKVTVFLLKNIKYNKERFKAGEEIEIAQKDVESFVKNGIIVDGE